MNGLLNHIKKEFHLFLMDYVQQFGKVISLKMGGATVVVLSDYKLIKKAFQSKDFTARPKIELMDLLLGGYGKSKSCLFWEFPVLHCKFPA